MCPKRILAVSFREVKVARECVTINQIRITYKFVQLSAVPLSAAQWEAGWRPV